MRVIICLLMVLLFSFTACSGGDDSDDSQYFNTTPEGTIRLFFDAYSNLDTDRIVNLYIEEVRDEIQSATSQYLAGFQSIRFDNLKIKLVSGTEDKAEMEVTYEAVYVENGGSPGNYPSQTTKFNLKKIAGEWIILWPPLAL